MINLMISIFAIALTAASTAVTVYYLGINQGLSVTESSQALLDVSTDMRQAVSSLHKSLNNAPNPDFSTPTQGQFCPSTRGRQKNQRAPVASGSGNLLNGESCLSPVVLSLLSSGSDKIVEALNPTNFVFSVRKPASMSWRWLSADYPVNSPATLSDYVGTLKAGAVCLRPDDSIDSSYKDANGNMPITVNGRTLRGLIEGVKDLNNQELACSGAGDCNLKRITHFLYFTENNEAGADISCRAAVRDGNTRADTFLLTNPNETNGNSYRVTLVIGI